MERKRAVQGRVIICALLLVIQIVLLVLTIMALNETYTIIYRIFSVMSVLVVLDILDRRTNPSFKIAWLVPIMVLPVFGVVVYLLFGNKDLGRRQMKKIETVQGDLLSVSPDDSEICHQLHEECPDAAIQAKYLKDYALAPIWKNTATKYFESGEAKHAELLVQLQKAKKYIFVEYFILQQGVMWDSVLETLKQKAAEGVDVRVMYDDFGCANKLPNNYFKTLRSYGIKAYSYNKIVPFLDVRLNNRDHRKILVIDGNVGFCGGINLADEYMNVTHPFGYWKDTAVMLTGSGVYSLTVMFLSLWRAVSGDKEDFNSYLPDPELCRKLPENGYVIPYGDYPYDHEPVGENVYLNLLGRAKKYVHICTPYLVTDNETITALCNAAKNGLDVVIITPGIPDKPYVYTVTRSNYEQLIDAGVRIYEFTPGFLHAKSFVVDGEYGVVGTVNLDYRSFYFHLECGVWMYKTSCIADMERDFQETVAKSTIPDKKIIRPSFFYRLGRTIMRLIAPLM